MQMSYTWVQWPMSRIVGHCTQALNETGLRDVSTRCPSWKKNGKG